MFYLYVNKYVV